MPALSRVDEYKGLTLEERKLLAEMGYLGSWQEAAKSMGMDRRKVLRMFKNPSFKDEYDKLFGTEQVKVLEREIHLVSEDAALILEEVKNAELNKTVHATCPKCGNKFDVFVRVIDYVTKMRALEIMLKTVGLWKDTKSVKVEGSVTHVNVTLTTAQMLALNALNRGQPVSPQVYAELEAMAASGAFELPALPVARSSIDAEFRVVTEEEDETDTARE